MSDSGLLLVNGSVHCQNNVKSLKSSPQDDTLSEVLQRYHHCLIAYYCSILLNCLNKAATCAFGLS